MYFRDSDMRHAPRSLSSLSLYSYGQYAYQLLTLMALMILLLASNSAFAAVANPGSTAACPAGMVKGSLTSSDYSNLVTNRDSAYVPITGAGSFPLDIKVSITNPPSSNNANNFAKGGTTDANSFLDLGRTDNRTKQAKEQGPAFTDLTFEFRKRGSTDSIYLSQVAVSLFDFDRGIEDRKKGRGWSDLAQIIGTPAGGGAPIKGTFRSLGGIGTPSFVQELPSGSTLGSGLTTASTDVDCSVDLDARCQASISFDQPVNSVKISFGHTNDIKDPTYHRLFIRLDSYCHKPNNYTISGTVFNDNGGISDTQANATIIGGIYDNNQYFNGLFDSTEKGITGSKIDLVNCANPTTIYATQTLTSTNASDIGKYSFTIPQASVGNQTSVCIVETTTNSNYPIRTTSNTKVVNSITGNYDYPDNNFGRVIANNTALVLKKYQYVNDCKVNLNYSDLTINQTTNDPTAGFSVSAASNVAPGQCIAYRIEAYNRGNIELTNVKITDKLQTTPVTSTFHKPFPVGVPTTINANSSALPSGTITSNLFPLAKASGGNTTKATLYFNTKYGTTNP